MHDDRCAAELRALLTRVANNAPAGQRQELRDRSDLAIGAIRAWSADDGSSPHRMVLHLAALAECLTRAGSGGVALAILDRLLRLLGALLVAEPPDVATLLQDLLLVRSVQSGVASKQEDWPVLQESFEAQIALLSLRRKFGPPAPRLDLALADLHFLVGSMLGTSPAAQGHFEAAVGLVRPLLISSPEQDNAERTRVSATRLLGDALEKLAAFRPTLA